MSRIPIAIVLVCRALTHTVHGGDDATQDLAQVEQLIRDIQKELPTGWTLEFKVAAHHLGSMRPAVSISSAEELPIEFVAPSPPPGGPEIQHARATMWLAFMPYLTPQEFDTARQRNDDRTHQRRQFVEANLNDVPFAGKVGDAEPKPPWGFSPRSVTETRLVQQYAFLWLATEPERLPSHHYGQLSIWLGQPPIKIHEEKREREFRETIAAVERIVKRYKNTTTD